MTSPDSPSPRTEAGKPFTFERWLAAVHEDHNGVIWTTKDELRAVFEHEFHAEAAQEAPAPDGLLHSRAHDAVGAWTHYFDAHDRVPFWKALCEAMGALAVETRKPAPPSPAEPPRPHDERESGERLARIIQEADAENPEWARGARFVLGWTKGHDDAALEIAFQAVRDPATDRAEARPPEGLDPDLSRVSDIAEWIGTDIAAVGSKATATHRDAWIAATVDICAALAARLSARGAEPR